MRTWLNGLAFYACWIPFTLIAGTLGLPALVSTRATWKLADLWCDGTLWLLRTCCHVRVQVPQLRSAGMRVYASNHESTLDTLVLWRALKHPAFILKRELYFIPIFGWYLWRCNPIAIRRYSGRALEPMLEQARACIAAQRNIIIFPEGTRCAPYMAKPYKRGVAALSIKLSERVQPVALATHQVWPKGCISKYPGIARFSACEPLEECGSDISGWLDMLEARIRTQASLLRGLP